MWRICLLLQYFQKKIGMHGEFHSFQMKKGPLSLKNLNPNGPTIDF